MKIILMTTAVILVGNTSVANETYCYNSGMSTLSVECVNSNKLHFKAAIQTYKNIKSKPTPITKNKDEPHQKRYFRLEQKILKLVGLKQ